MRGWQMGRKMESVGRKAKLSWMTAQEFAKARESLGISQIDLAAVLDVTKTTISNYERGAIPIPKVIRMLVDAAVAKKIRLK